MKVVLAFACLIALASARSTLKLREAAAAPVTAEDGLEILEKAGKFSQKVREPLRNIQKLALDLLSGSVSMDQAEDDFGKAEGELKALAQESEKLQAGMGDKLEQLKEHGVKDRTVCAVMGKHLCGTVKNIVENDPADADPIWGELLQAVAGSLECIAGKFDAFEGYLGDLKGDIEDAQAGRKRRDVSDKLQKLMSILDDHSVELPENLDPSDLLAMLENHRPRPTGEGRRPRPTGSSGEGRDRDLMHKLAKLLHKHMGASSEENEKRFTHEHPPRPTGHGPRPTGFSGEHSGDMSGPHRHGGRHQGASSEENEKRFTHEHPPRPTGHSPRPTGFSGEHSGDMSGPHRHGGRHQGSSSEENEKRFTHDNPRPTGHGPRLTGFSGEHSGDMSGPHRHGPRPTGFSGEHSGDMSGPHRHGGRHQGTSSEENEHPRPTGHGPRPIGFSGEHSGDMSGHHGPPSSEDVSGAGHKGGRRGGRHHSGERRHPTPEGSEEEDEEKRNFPSLEEVRENGKFMMEVEGKTASVQFLLKHLHGNVERFMDCLAPLKQNKRNQNLRDLMQKVRDLTSDLEYAGRFLH